MGTAALFAATILAGAPAVRGADVGADYPGDASLMVKVTGGSETSNGYGAVSYDYRIGKYEVTNAQYAKFLNTIGVTTSNNSLGLYNPSQSSFGLTWNGSVFVGDNRPVVYVSFYDAARFVNWLTNGGTATSATETGVYTLGDGTGITRNADAWNAGGFAIASENEWYRAAYYDPTMNKGEGGFWNYATRSNDCSGDPEASNGQNYGGSGNGDQTLAVGSFSHAPSYFGTYDQGGNVWEWTETIVGTGANRVLRGGSCYGSIANLSAASGRDDTLAATYEGSSRGFRIVSLMAVPEPEAYAGAAGLATLVVCAWLRRGRRVCSR